MTADNSNFKKLQIPASWDPLDAVLLIWPHQENTLLLEDLEYLYEALITVLIDYVDVILIAPTEQHASIRDRLISMDVPMEYVYLYDIPAEGIKICNYGPLFSRHSSRFCVVNENQFIQDVNQQIISFNQETVSDLKFFQNDLDSDGNGFLIIDKYSLKRHNPTYSDELLVHKLDELFDNYCQLWIDRELHDNIRLCSKNTLLVDESIREEILNGWNSQSPLFAVKGTLPQETPKLMSLPSGTTKSDENGVDIQLKYTQFLVVNELVLVPQYDVASDIDALEIMSDLFPGYDIIGFPSEILSLLGTGLVNIVQPIPEGVLGFD